MVSFNYNFGADALILAGDVIDFKRLYTKDVQTEGISWVDEAKEALKVLEFLLENFGKVYWFAGNHDWRLSRKLQSDVDAMKLMKLIYNKDRLKISSHFYCEVNDWLYANHPERARANKVSLGEDLCERYLKSVINFHSHRFSFAVHKSGKFVHGDGLHLTIPDAHEYKVKKLGTYDEWVSGWWVVDNNKIWPYVKHDRIRVPGYL